MSMSDIIRMGSGSINTVNDTVIGGVPALPSTTDSLVAGQLGKEINLDDSQVIYNSTIGTVYGGTFRYVRLAATSTAVVVGQIVFWDISVADNLYQVTTSEAGSTLGAQFRAGIVLNSGWTAGNYSFIQCVGPTYTKFRAALTGAGAVGIAVYCAAAGAGVDNGFADVISSANPTQFGDVALMQDRYLGSASQLPTNGGLTLVNLNILNRRG